MRLVSSLAQEGPDDDHREQAARGRRLALCQSTLPTGHALGRLDGGLPQSPGAGGREQPHTAAGAVTD